MRVMGIETSCDETGVAVYDTSKGLVAQELYSQVRLHAEFGGVVPELASRDHVRKLTPLIQRVVKAAGPEAIDGIAYTAGPGLIGALLVGASLGQALAYAWNIPVLGVHHMEGHLLAPLLESDKPSFPFVALLVSGGHTLLVRVEGIGEYHVMGETLDDAVGEAFDKTAKLLGLPYPGGPALAELATRGRAGRYDLPRPMTDRPGLDFSFSGLKTAVLTIVRREAGMDEQDRADLALAFETAVVETLTIKCKRALDMSDDSQLVVAGGVGANRSLREHLKAELGARGGKVFFPRPEFCTDNGAMIAYAGACRMQAGQCSNTPVQARWPLDSLRPPAGQVS